MQSYNKNWIMGRMTNAQRIYAMESLAKLLNVTNRVEIVLESLDDDADAAHVLGWFQNHHGAFLGEEGHPQLDRFAMLVQLRSEHEFDRSYKDNDNYNGYEKGHDGGGRHGGRGHGGGRGRRRVPGGGGIGCGDGE
nr:uncharacterized protein LOC107407561 isoform X1 [Ziziphus jujuba var. spinosa]